MPRIPEQNIRSEDQTRPRRQRRLGLVGRMPLELAEVPSEWQGFNDWYRGISLGDRITIRREGKFPEGTPDLFAEIYSKTTVEERLLHVFFGYPAVEDVIARTPEEVQRRKEEQSISSIVCNYNILMDQVGEMLASLTERERQVIGLRFGLEDGRPRTLKEAGEAIGRSSRTAGRIEQSGLTKLRDNPNSRKLHDILEDSLA